MAENKDFFTDSTAYELAMGRCSRIAGKYFLDWLSLPNGLKWLDVGCGTGSFTELIINHNTPSSIDGIDPSEGQIEFAKGKSWASGVDFRTGDAMSLPYGDATFDVAVMALVIQYIPDPSKAMSEITRVVRPGGTVATYTWPGSLEEHPMRPMSQAINEIGVSRPSRPGNQIRTIEGLTDLFNAAGLEDIESRSLDFQLVFDDFDDYWSSQTADTVRYMTDEQTERLKALLRKRLPTDESGQISYSARANAIRGRMPA